MSTQVEVRGIKAGRSLDEYQVAALSMSGRPARGRQKARKEAQPLAPLKIVVRRLPPNLPEHIFHTSISSWHKSIDWFEYISGKLATSRVKSDKSSRAYLKFRKVADSTGFVKNFQGHRFVSSDGKEYRACVEIAPFQKVPRPPTATAKAKDSLSGTIDQDADFLAFQESLKVVVPHKKEETVVVNKITPLIEHLRAQKAKTTAKAKARKAKEALGKGKQQEEKKKAAQAQADLTTSKMKERVTAANGKSSSAKSNGVKGPPPKSDLPAVATNNNPAGATSNTKKNSKTVRKKPAETSSKASALPDGPSQKRTPQSLVAPKPSSLAQERTPKNSVASSPRQAEGEQKMARPKRGKKKEGGKQGQQLGKQTVSKTNNLVDISGPTPAEMAALSKEKT